MKTAAKPSGLRYWMLRVLEECDNVAADFHADPVHDLRVSLRRCRSLADGMMVLDPEHSWKAMKKAGKQLFRQLGSLRDVQIMMEWIEKLELASGPVARTPSAQSPEEPEISPLLSAGAPLLEPSLQHDHDPADTLMQILRSRETEHKHEARAAVEGFDRKQWRQWSKSLPLRATRIRPGSAVFRHLALERWTAARGLHTRAMRNRSQIALHTLRIGIKRFRYIVENFLPEQHQLWGDDLKHMQDLLGDVHDLDVLWATALSGRIFPDDASRKVWHTRILEARGQRVEEYRQRTVGPESLWNVWRAGLPQGKQIQQIATRRMKLWANALDPDFAHSERVARVALELYDGLSAGGHFGVATTAETSSGGGSDARDALYVAALLHDVGKAKGNKGHHKESLELIKKHGTPLGWKPSTMTLAAIVARFHCGALPTRSHKALRDLLPDEQRTVIRLSAILRLANALDSLHDGRVRRVRIQNVNEAKQRINGFRRRPVPLGKNQALIIAAEGYSTGSVTAQAVAAERYLLESVLRRPLLVQPSSGVRPPVSKGRRAASA